MSRSLPRRDKDLLKTMKECVGNAMNLALKDKSPLSKKEEPISPFFVSFVIKENWGQDIHVANGSIFKIENLPITPVKSGRGQLRIGDYKLGCGMEILTPDIPLGNNPLAIKRSFWKEANEAFYEALAGLEQNISQSRGIPEQHKPMIFFSKEKPVQFFDPIKSVKINFNYWKELLKKTSELFLRDKIIDSLITFSFENEKRYYINSEGTVIYDYTPSAEIVMHGKIVTKDNLVLDSYEVFSTTDFNKLPSEEELTIAAERLIKDLYDLRHAPNEESGNYPVLCDGQFHGLIWHEAIGHATEAHRLEEDDDGESGSDEEYDTTDESSLITLKNKLGKKIAPDFINVYDDPTLPGYHGSYKYDEEGVPAQKTTLIENGVLKTLLFSRESAGKFTKRTGKETKSNGHARAGFGEDPVPRMSNLVISSKNEHSMNELKEMLLRKCRDQNKPFGLLLEDIERGVSISSSYFKAFPKRIFRLYPNGKTERVKGVYVGNNPLQIIENIAATSGSYINSNGICWAESGTIPTGTTAPDAFIKSVGFGVIPRSAYDKFPPPLSRPPRLRKK